jgi:NADPH2:quinone reductase
MMNAIWIEKTGGPEVLQLVDRPAPQPGLGEVLVDIAAAGVNYMDVGTRTGMYTQKPLPMTPGVEGAGRVARLGAGVTGFAVGDRVAWFYAIQSYAQQIAAPAAALVPLPDGIELDTAAAVMMQGLSASHFVTETYAIKPGDWALVHSAAGGLGLMLTQMIKILGGKVIGRVSTIEKIAIARAAGADEVIVSADGNFADDVRRLTGGSGVRVVNDGAGAETFAGSVASLDYHGVLAYYGQTIKRQAPIDLLDLPRSILVSYPSVIHHVRTREALLKWSGRLFDWLLADQLKVRISQRYPLAQAAQAHRDIQSRSTTGKLLLIP